MIDKIVEEYTTNKEHYDLVSKTIKENIQGRSCHFKVILLYLLHKCIPIDIYVEIGVHNGTSMSCVLQGPVKKAIGIDLFEETISRYAPDNLSIKRTESNIQKNNTYHSTVQLIKGNSFSPSTEDELVQALEGSMIDVLFIDGLHEYAGIQNDFERYSKYVKKNGFIILDDYEPNYPDILKYVDTHVKDNSSYKIIGVFLNNELIIQKLF